MNECITLILSTYNKISRRRTKLGSIRLFHPSLSYRAYNWSCFWVLLPFCCCCCWVCCCGWCLWNIWGLIESCWNLVGSPFISAVAIFNLWTSAVKASLRASRSCACCSMACSRNFNSLFSLLSPAESLCNRVSWADNVVASVCKVWTLCSNSAIYRNFRSL